MQTLLDNLIYDLGTKLFIHLLITIQVHYPYWQAYTTLLEKPSSKYQTFSWLLNDFYFKKCCQENVKINAMTKTRRLQLEAAFRARF